MLSSCEDPFIYSFIDVMYLILHYYNSCPSLKAVFLSLFQLSNTFGGAWGEEKTDPESPSAGCLFF